MLIANQARSPIGAMSARLPRALLSLCCEARRAGTTALGSGSVSPVHLCVCVYVYILICKCVCGHVRAGASRDAPSPLLSHRQLPQSLLRRRDVNAKQPSLCLHSRDGPHSHSQSLQSAVRSALFSSGLRPQPKRDTCVRGLTAADCRY